MDKIIDIAIPAWPNHPKRLEYVSRVIESLRANLFASRHLLRYFCSAESERDPGHEWKGTQLTKLCEKHGIPLVYRDGPASLGGNMNSAIQMCTSPWILVVQDDWMLRSPIDLSDGVDFMQRRSDIALIRYEVPVRKTGGTAFCGGDGEFRKVDIAGPWPYGDGPHLRRQDFWTKFGWYKESGKHGRSEVAMQKLLVKRNANIWATAASHFQNIGDVASVPESQDWRRPRRVRR